MSNLPPQQKSVFSTVWEWIGHFGTAQVLWAVAGSIVLAARAVFLVPQGWNATQVSLVASSVFFVALASIVTLVVSGKWIEANLIRKWKRMRSPHLLTITMNGGQNANLTLRHTGEPATWMAEGRIVKMLDDSVNPDPSLRQCKLIKGNSLSDSLKLSESEWMEINIAGVTSSEWRSGTWIMATFGGYSDRTKVPDEGAIVEISLRASPPTKEGVLRRHFQVTRNEQEWNCLDLKDVTPTAPDSRS